MGQPASPTVGLPRGDLAWEGDASQLARPPTSGKLERAVCPGTLGVRGGPQRTKEGWVWAGVGVSSRTGLTR